MKFDYNWLFNLREVVRKCCGKMTDINVACLCYKLPRSYWLRLARKGLTDVSDQHCLLNAMRFFFV